MQPLRFLCPVCHTEQMIPFDETQLSNTRITCNNCRQALTITTLECRVYEIAVYVPPTVAPATIPYYDYDC